MRVYLLLAAAACCLHGAVRAERPRGRALPPHHRALVETSGAPEQVHLSLTGSTSEMLVSWATWAVVPDAVTVSFGVRADSLTTTVYGAQSVAAYSQLQFYDPQSLLQPTLPEVAEARNAASAQLVCQQLATPTYQGGKPASCGGSGSLPKSPTFGVTSNPDNIYSSPVLVSTLLQNLQPATRYWYRIGGDATVRNFTMPPPQADQRGAFPMAIALTADVGQTVVSEAVLARAAADADVRLVLLAGDWSYADGYGARWDVFGRLLEPLASRTPVMGCAGNHEMERGESFAPFIARYPVPWAASKSASPLDYAFVAGPAQVIVLSAYAGAAGVQRQATWLRGALMRVDRRKTPWLIAVFHTAWYSSNTNKLYTRAGEVLRWSVEQLLYEAGVDIIVSGHIHSYERSYPVLNRTLDACGPVHLNVGDASAHGGPMIGWVQPAPNWSAFREASFGGGKLELLNATHARWTWLRVACAKTANAAAADANWTPVWDAEHCSSTDDTSSMAHLPSDTAWIVRHSSCANKQMAADVERVEEVTADAAEAPSPDAAGDDADEDGDP